VTADTVESLKKARSLLIILIATCDTTLLALDAVANVLDTDMTEDIRKMVGRSKGELAEVNERIARYDDAL
jgi:uncharacterized protein YybS (DUF2232 family)